MTPLEKMLADLAAAREPSANLALSKLDQRYDDFCWARLPRYRTSGAEANLFEAEWDRHINRGKD